MLLIVFGWFLLRVSVIFCSFGDILVIHLKDELISYSLIECNQYVGRSLTNQYTQIIETKRTKKTHITLVGAIQFRCFLYGHWIYLGDYFASEMLVLVVARRVKSREKSVQKSIRERPQAIDISQTTVITFAPKSHETCFYSRGYRSTEV